MFQLLIKIRKALDTEAAGPGLLRQRVAPSLRKGLGVNCSVLLLQVRYHIISSLE